MKKVLAILQKLGKALMLPIASLPIAGLLLRLGQPDVLNIPIMADAGNTLFENLPLLFAIGIAVGLARKNDGAAGLAGAISYFVLNATSQAVNYAIQAGTIFSIEDTSSFATINIAHFGGIIAGVIAGLCYNRFHATRLPDWLQFFGGRRFVPIVTGGVSLLIGMGLGLVWPSFQNGLDAAANWMVISGGIGAFIYGVLNRLMLPLGLHHVVNTAVWFNFGSYTNAAGEVITGDLSRFFASQGMEGGVFTAGFFPIMMLALPAAALAMYVCAKQEKKAMIGGALFSVAFTAFLTGITEPIEFMFMFLAPGLFLIHGALTGLALAICQMLGITNSFTFSAGAIDYALNFGIAGKPIALLLVGLVFAAVYFALFVFVIRKFDLKTPGREDDQERTTFSSLEKQKGMAALAAEYLQLIGGKQNIKEIEACITRIRLTLHDNTGIDEKALKELGASGVMKAGKQVTQIIIGTKAELLVDEIKKLLS